MISDPDPAQTSEAFSIERRLTPVDKNSFEPLYFQIQSQLEQLIRTRALQPGDALPGEAELSRIFGVSRMTSRQALQGLETDGLARRERGRGTFVRLPKVEKRIAHLLGFTAEMALLGLTATTRVLSQGHAIAGSQIAASLRLPSGSRLIVLRRLRLADDEPIAIEHVSIPLSRFPGIQTVDFGTSSLYEIFRDRFGVEIGSANETIEARGATREEARLLHITPGSSLLAVTRTLLDSEGIPVEYGQSLYRGDRYRAVLHVPATEPVPPEVTSSRRTQ